MRLSKYTPILNSSLLLRFISTGEIYLFNFRSRVPYNRPNNGPKVQEAIEAVFSDFSSNRSSMLGYPSTRKLKRGLSQTKLLLVDRR